MRGWLAFLAKLAASIVLLWFVLSRVTWTEVREALADPRWEWLVAALAIYALSAWGGAVQWSWLLRVAGLRTPPSEIRRLYFIGLFFNNFLPANIGGDAYKIIDLGRRERCAGRVFCVTLLDRLVGLAALTSFASLAAILCLVWGIPLPRVAWVLVAVLLFLAIAVAMLVSRRLGARVPDGLRRLRLPALARQTEMAVREFGVFRSRWPWLGRVFLFGVGVQALRILVHLLVAFGLHLDPSAAQSVQLMVLIPLLALSLTLPVTVNGIGLRETVSNTLLVFTGLTRHGVVAMEMTAFLVVIVVSLVGGALWWHSRFAAPVSVDRDAGA